MRRVILIALFVISVLGLSSCEKHNVKLPSLANTTWEANYTALSGDSNEKITITLSFGKDISTCRIERINDNPLSNYVFSVIKIIPECGNYGVDTYELFNMVSSDIEPDYRFNYNGKTITITDLWTGEFSALTLEKKK